MSDLLYLNPYQRQTPGIRYKVDAEIAALRKRHCVTEFPLVPCTDYNWLRKTIIRLSRELSLPVRIMLADQAYYRYSPACPLANLWLGLLASRRHIWIEYNTVYRQELMHVSPSLVVLHRLSMAVLRRSKATHIAVTREIAQKEKLPSGFRIMPNGYSVSSPEDTANSRPLDKMKLEKLRSAKNHGLRILVFTASHDTPWQGLDRVLMLVRELGDICLALIGRFNNTRKMEKTQLIEGTRVINFGELTPVSLAPVYKLANAGVGPFAIDRKGLTQACPLKVRDYLCHGLPVVINYDDPLLYEEWAHQHIHQYSTDLNKLRQFLNHDVDRAKLQCRARKELDWAATMERAGVL